MGLPADEPNHDSNNPGLDGITSLEECLQADKNVDIIFDLEKSAYKIIMGPHSHLPREV